ncbi:pectate lyase-like protein [Paraburkholderia sp. BL18I3N2]|uniref:glycosyl hydrolase family 28-related protein n=1 Tax=Paraburkholderia sp. BL18I3N2 TaxID=1938799 RepID=UPI000D052E42|nr:glycosyl hydrolase family 28-related protein [Paraburkholderia sp. BL18I3N2]PRX28216.1 pectate lyase-like protein [Paraburkholderia sp. BL18I3N2]
MTNRRQAIKGALAGTILGAAAAVNGQTKPDASSVDTGLSKDTPSGTGNAQSIAFKAAAPASIVRTVAEELNDADINPKRFGAKGDGRTDDSVAIQSAIDLLEARGGGVVRFPAGRYRCNVILKNGVSLVSSSTMFGYLPGRISGVTLVQADHGFVVDTPSTLVRGIGISGINFEGRGANLNGGGVRFQLVKWAAIRRCTANNFADQGFQHLAGFGVVFEDILTTNVLLNRQRDRVSGCIETFGTDDFLNRIEANPSLIAGRGLVTQDLLLCGIVVGGANNFLSNCIGEDAERGIYIAPLRGSQHRISQCRGDSNIGHGFYVDGSAIWSTCFGYNNSSAEVGTYSGFYMSSKSCSNVLTSCRSEGRKERLQKYGFEDYVSESDPDARNQYFACAGSFNQAGLFLVQNHEGSSVSGAPLTTKPPAGTRIVNVTGSGLVVLDNYMTPTEISYFSGAADGQTIRVLGNPNVTIVHGSGIVTRSSKDVVLKADTIYAFTRYVDKWYMN